MTIITPPNDVFYFGMGFAPIFPNLEQYNTGAKQFGYVLSVMRRARKISPEDFQKSLFGDTGRSTIDRWEQGSAGYAPLEKMQEIASILNLDSDDTDYLVGLITGYPHFPELTEDEKTIAFKLFEPYRERPYPAYLADHNLTILAYNMTTAIRLLRLRPETAETSIGRSILEIFFDPKSQLIQAFDNDTEKFNINALEQIQRFRGAAIHFRHCSNYMKLIYNLMNGGWMNFFNLWYQQPNPVDRGADWQLEFNNMKFQLKDETRHFTGRKYIRIIYYEPVTD